VECVEYAGYAGYVRYLGVPRGKLAWYVEYVDFFEVSQSTWSGT